MTIYLALLTERGEAQYEGYSRQLFGSLRAHGTTVSNEKAVQFPECRNGTETILGFRFYKEGKQVGEDGELLAPLKVERGLMPVFHPGQLVIDVFSEPAASALPA